MINHNLLEDEIIMEARNVCKLYGLNKQDAAQMLAKGQGKDTVYKKTGVTTALWDVSFQVKKGEIFVIIGLSGSGKSTIIRCFNQLLRPTSGHVFFQNKKIESLKKKELLEFRRSKVSMVFQNFGLLTHRNVMDNVAYGLEVRGMSRQERESKSMELIHMVGLDGWENKPISSLSGGMKQRVGIARALANNPEVLLMDEPFSALDPLVRKDMQFELLTIQRKLGKTIIFITHDINEAFKLGDSVAIMRDGRIVQIGTPEGMTSNPADEYVRQFIDSADKTKIYNVKHIMTTPTCLVRKNDTPIQAVHEMRNNGVSTAFTVDDKMKLTGIVTIDRALDALQKNLPLRDFIEHDIITTTANSTISDILPVAAEAKYPLAVVDENRILIGIVSKAAVLSAMI